MLLTPTLSFVKAYWSHHPHKDKIFNFKMPTDLNSGTEDIRNITSRWFYDIFNFEFCHFFVFDSCTEWHIFRKVWELTPHLVRNVNLVTFIFNYLSSILWHFDSPCPCLPIMSIWWHQVLSLNSLSSFWSFWYCINQI